MQNRSYMIFRKIIDIKKNCSIYDVESVVHDLWACLSENQCKTKELFSSYAILCLRDTFRNSTPRMNENALMNKI